MTNQLPNEQIPKKNDPNQMTDRIINDKRSKFDLEERTTRYGIAVIAFCKSLASVKVAEPLVKQLIRSGTSIGANYCEADDAESKKDFNHKIGIAKKETRETKYWLRIIATSFPEYREPAKELWQEAKELHLIFGAILRTAKSPKP